MSYLKLWNYIYIYISFVRPVASIMSSPSSPSSSSVRPSVPSSVSSSSSGLCSSVPSFPVVAGVVLCPSVRPVVRPVVVVRPLPVRPRPSRRRHPSSVRPVRGARKASDDSSDEGAVVGQRSIVHDISRQNHLTSSRSCRRPNTSNRITKSEARHTCTHTHTHTHTHITTLGRGTPQRRA